MVAAVAMEEPQIPPKPAEAQTVAMASPPRRWRLLQRLQALPVGLVPGLASEAREVLTGELLDRVLVRLRQLVPLVLVHEEAEGRAVHPAREQRRLLEHGVELEGDDRLHREEDAVGDPALEELVGLRRGLHERRGAQRLRHRLRHAAASADL